VEAIDLGEIDNYSKQFELYPEHRQENALKNYHYIRWKELRINFR
jgi:hypothetical protein